MKHWPRFNTKSCVLAVLSLWTVSVSAQVGVFTKDHLREYSPDWKGDRFPDGRPKVADDLISRMKGVSIEDAYYVLEAAQNVVFVPGYGMAVAQAHHAVRDLRAGMDETHLRQKLGLSKIQWREIGMKLGKLTGPAL